jgi:hypothetical protein
MKTQGVLDKWIKREMDGPRLKVEPGRYRITFKTNNSYLEAITAQGIETYQTNEPILTMTRIASV